MTKFEYVEGTYNKRWYPEAASQSFKKGQPVYLEAGLLTECASDSTEVLGIADADASGTTNTWLPVIVAASDTVFAGSTTNAGADVTLAVTHIGKHYALYESSNSVYVDLGDTDNDCIKPIAVHPDCIPASASATLANSTNGKVLFKFLDAVLQFVDVEMT
jgi:hypothetical protein